MKTMDILKEQEFKELTQTRADSRNRVCLGKELSELIPRETLYKVYRNSSGQVILDPQVTIPASEAWIFENKSVFKALKAGVQDAREGKVRKAKEDYSKYADEG